MKRRNWSLLIGLPVLGLGILVFRPVPIPHESECLLAEGMVTDIYEAGAGDVVFRLQNIDKEFYINRGLEHGLDIINLKENLTNREVLIKYPRYWTPLDPDNSVRHISKIEHEGRVVFTELN